MPKGSRNTAHAPKAPRRASSRAAPAAALPEPKSKDRFESDALPVLSALCASFGALLHALPDQIDGPRDLERALEIDYVLAWRTYKVATATDPAAVGADIPRAAPMKRLLEAARRRRVRAAIIDKVRSAYADFENLVRRHAGDDPKRGPSSRSRSGGRAVFDALIGGVRQGASQSLDLVHRRMAFKGNAYIWGMQAQTMLRCAIWHKGETPGAIDAAGISAYTQLHALRPDVPLVLKRVTGIYRKNTLNPQGPDEHLPPTTTNMLEDFCSRPLPEVQSTLSADGCLDVSLRFEGVGKGAAVDCATIDVSRNANNSVPQPSYGLSVHGIMPAEVLLNVVLVPRGWTDPATMRVTTHGNPAVWESLRNQYPFPFEMPVRETVEHLGSDVDAVDTADFPRLPDMIRAALDRQGWQDAEYDIFRCRVRYPILHAIVHLSINAVPPR